MTSSFLGIGILSWLTFLPVFGMVIVLSLPKNRPDIIRWTSLGVTFFQVVLAVVVFNHFDRGLAGINDQSTMQFVEKAQWIDVKSVSWFGRVHIEYLLGIDGISVVMVLLTAIVSFIATLSSWTIEKSVKGYFALFLLLDAGMMGVFVALDFFLFYMFWEIMLAPDVLPDRHLGRAAARICRNQVLPVHAAGQRADAARDARPLLQHERVYRSGRHPVLGVPRRSQGSSRDWRRSTRSIMLADDGPGQLCPGSLLAGIGHVVALCRLRRAVHRVRDQSAALPVPYLAARRARRGADPHQRHPRRRSAENGNVRHAPHQLPGLSGCHAAFLLGARAARRHQHGLRRAGRDGADRFQETHRLFVASAIWGSSSWAWRR